MTGANYWLVVGPVLLGLTVIGTVLASIWMLRRRFSARRGRENLDETWRGTVTGGHLKGEPPQLNRR